MRNDVELSNCLYYKVRKHTFVENLPNERCRLFVYKSFAY